MVKYLLNVDASAGPFDVWGWALTVGPNIPGVLRKTFWPTNPPMCLGHHRDEHGSLFVWQVMFFGFTYLFWFYEISVETKFTWPFFFHISFCVTASKVKLTSCGRWSLTVAGTSWMWQTLGAYCVPPTQRYFFLCIVHTSTTRFISSFVFSKIISVIISVSIYICPVLLRFPSVCQKSSEFKLTTYKLLQ